MNDTQKVSDWVRYYKTAPEGYKPFALQAVLRNDGVKVLAMVLRSLGLESSVDMVRDWDVAEAERGPQEAAAEVSGEESLNRGSAGEKG